MAEPIVVEFDLTRNELKDLFASRAQHIRATVTSALVLVFGIAAVIAGKSDGAGVTTGFGTFCLVIGAFLLLAQTRAPQVRGRMADRLAGATKVQLSDRGVEYSGANVAERIEWSRMMRVLDRPRSWVLMTKTPVASYFIPKTAVPADQQQDFAAQLALWAGKAYKIRKR